MLESEPSNSQDDSNVNQDNQQENSEEEEDNQQANLEGEEKENQQTSICKVPIDA